MWYIDEKPFRDALEFPHLSQTPGKISEKAAT
jgi:hypothetical protein